MEHSLQQLNSAIVVYMGGPIFLKQVIINREEELLITGPEDLEFHVNWNWLMPVWKKLRKELIESPTKSTTMFKLVQAIDEANIVIFHELIGNYCIEWCIRKQIKL